MFTDSTDKGNQLQRRNLNQKFVSYTKGGCFMNVTFYHENY